MIPLSRPVYQQRQLEYIDDLLRKGQLVGLGPYTKQCVQYFESLSREPTKAWLVPNGTFALEFAALTADIQPGDEVIIPSYTYISTANAFVLRGATPVFVGIEEHTMNIDVHAIEAAITPRTRAIVPVHYAGIPCDMDAIMAIAAEHNLLVIEDAAQGIAATYKGRALGTIGHIGCFSFHETKNITSAGQGGAVTVNDSRLFDRARAIFDNGTNRALFMEGKVSQYSWTTLGSNFLMSEPAAACLWAQLEVLDDMQRTRRALYDKYSKALASLEAHGHVRFPRMPDDIEHNSHLFYVEVADPRERKPLMDHLRSLGIASSPHYVPLHLSEAGKRLGRFVGDDSRTRVAADSLLRLPLFVDMTPDEQIKVAGAVKAFWGLTNGVNGVSGTNGTKGTNGIHGANGTNGTNGVRAVDGTNGVNGVNGVH